MSENLAVPWSERRSILIKVQAYRPYSGRKHVEVRRYAEGTQETTDPALNAADMVGITVATMTESRLETTTHSARPAKMGRSFLKGKRLVWSVSSTWPLGVVLPGVFTTVLSSEGEDIALMQENGDGGRRTTGAKRRTTRHQVEADKRGEKGSRM
jgi:hypothetical protein